MLFIGLVFALHDRCMVAITISLIYTFDIVIYEYITGCMLKTDVLLRLLLLITVGALNLFVRSIDVHKADKK